MPAPTHRHRISPLHGEKRALRARILARRDAFSAIERAAASSAICSTLAILPDFQAANQVLLTVPFGSETDTRPLLEHALASDKLVLLPRVDREARMLELRQVQDLERDLAPGRWNIPEPRPEFCRLADPWQIDWVLVPGVAFDHYGGRLGYGGGFYDRLLPLLRPEVQRAAAAFSLQLVDRVPRGKHDLAVDLIVTEEGLLETLDSTPERSHERPDH